MVVDPESEGGVLLVDEGKSAVETVLVVLAIEAGHKAVHERTVFEKTGSSDRSSCHKLPIIKLFGNRLSYDSIELIMFYCICGSTFRFPSAMISSIDFIKHSA